jgi:hypothetical protein
MAHLQSRRYSICSLPFCIRSFSLFTSCCPSSGALPSPLRAPNPLD